MYTVMALPNLNMLLFDCGGNHANGSRQQAFLHPETGFTFIASETMVRLSNSANPVIQLSATPEHAYILGKNGDPICREFTVRINSQSISSFKLQISPEPDAEHSSLSVFLDDDQELLNFFEIGSQYTINLNDYLEYIFHDNTNTFRTISFRQCIILECGGSNEIEVATVTADVECGCANKLPIAPLPLNASANKNPAFTFISNNLIAVNANSTALCAGSYYYDIRVEVSNSTANLTNISIPLDTRFFPN